MSVTMLASADTLLPGEESRDLDYTTVKQQYADGASSRTTPAAAITAMFVPLPPNDNSITIKARS